MTTDSAPVAAVPPPAPAVYSPWPFVLTLSFVSAFPNAASSNLAALFYKSQGYSNEVVGYTGLLFLPFAASFLWAPWVDRSGSKRAWLLGTTWGLAGAFAALAATVAVAGPVLWPTLLANWLRTRGLLDHPAH